MKDDAHPDRRRQTKRTRESEGMKERQNPKNLVVAPKHEDLIELLDIGGHVVVSENDTLGIAGATAGKDDGSNVVESDFLACPNGLFDKSHGHEPGNEGGDQTFEYSRFICKILDDDGLRRRLNVDALQKSVGRNHRFQVALFGA